MGIRERGKDGQPAIRAAMQLRGGGTRTVGRHHCCCGCRGCRDQTLERRMVVVPAAPVAVVAPMVVVVVVAAAAEAAAAVVHVCACACVNSYARSGSVMWRGGGVGGSFGVFRGCANPWASQTPNDKPRARLKRRGQALIPWVDTMAPAWVGTRHGLGAKHQWLPSIRKSTAARAGAKRVGVATVTPRTGLDERNGQQCRGHGLNRGVPVPGARSISASFAVWGLDLAIRQ